jgi:metal-responsive CopG/Arc/MetJ family transcriptional regulator
MTMKQKQTYYQKNTRINAVFPNDLIKKIEKYVEDKELSRNQLYIQAITEYLERNREMDM